MPWGRRYRSDSRLLRAVLGVAGLTEKGFPL